MLLDKGAKANAQGGFYGIDPASNASFGGRRFIYQRYAGVSLNKGAKAKAKGGSYGTDSTPDVSLRGRRFISQRYIKLYAFTTSRLTSYSTCIG